MYNYFRTVWAFIGCACGWFFGQADGFLFALIAVCFMDYFTGVFNAAVHHQLSSAIGFKGIARKITIFVLVGIAHVIDKELLGHTALLRDGVIFFYLSNEGISILENAVALDLPVPNALKKLLLQIKNKK